MDLTEIANNSIDILKQNSPKLLLVAGIGSSIGATALCGINTVKAVETVNDIRTNPKYDNYSKGKLAGVYAKELVPLYAPVVILAGAGAACSIGSYNIQTKRLAASVAALELSTEAYRAARRGIKTVYGKEGLKEVDKAVAEEEAKKKQDGEDNVCVVYGKDILFHDLATNTFFMSNKDDICEAVTEFNSSIVNYVNVSVNEWADMLDIPHVSFGDDMGWDGRYMPLRITYTADIAPNGKPCLAINYNVPPIADYRRRHV